MRKLLLTPILLLLFVAAASAQLRSDAEMRKAALSVLKEANNTTLKAKATDNDLKKLESRSQITVFGSKGKGFAVVANDSRYPTVLGYSDANTDFQPNNLAPGFVWWLEAINESLEQMAANGQAYKAPEVGNGVKESVSELLTTRWGQGDPYNRKTPEYTEDNGKTYTHYVTGCVATAMAQILNYHEYPTRGKSQISYTTIPEAGSAIQVNANFNTRLEWENMLDVYTSGFTEAQADAVATLMKLCGASVKMQYKKDGSGAYTSDACIALRKYFKYDEHIRYYFRDYFPVDEWMEIIFKELSDGYPVLYGGANANGGHEFVLDGYNPKGLVHVNWGWYGTQNGYFDIASLNGYTRQQEMVAVRPVLDNSKYVSLWGMTEGFGVTQINATTINVAECVVYNFDVEEFTGQLGLLAKNLNTNEITVLKTSNISNAAWGSGARMSVNNLSVASLPQGPYRIYWASKGTTEEEWQPVRAHENTCNSYILNRLEQGISLEPVKDANWTATAIQEIKTDSKSSTRIFNLRGQYVGTDMKSLPKGVYIVGGKRIVK